MPPDLLSLASNAVCVAVLTGLLASLVLSTAPRPTSVLLEIVLMVNVAFSSTTLTGWLVVATETVAVSPVTVIEVVLSVTVTVSLSSVTVISVGISNS